MHVVRHLAASVAAVGVKEEELEASLELLGPRDATPMTVRFQADADLNAEIVAGALRREPSIDFQMADEANLRRLREPAVLALAAQERRIVVTHDRHTMLRHFADFLLHHSSPGVFLMAQTVSMRVASEECLLVWAASKRLMHILCLIQSG